MAGPGIPFRVLRWFPASSPGEPRPPGNLAGLNIPSRVLRWFPASPPGEPRPMVAAQARWDRIPRAPQDSPLPRGAQHLPQAPSPEPAPLSIPESKLPAPARAPWRASAPARAPLSIPESIPESMFRGRGRAPASATEALLRARARGRGPRPVPVGADLSTPEALRRLTDAVYTAAIINNPSAFALNSTSRPLIITPGTARLAADNQMSEHPLFVRIKGATDGNGAATNLYVGRDQSEAASGTIAPIAIYAVAPTVELILSGYGQVWVDGTAPGGAATFAVLVSTFQINGRNTVYPR